MIFKNNYISLLRTKHNVSQEKLAEVVGVNQSQISRFESGGMIPSVTQLIRIAEFFKVDIGSFFAKENKYNVSENIDYFRPEGSTATNQKLIDDLYRVIDEQRELINHYREIARKKED
jgi:transcriptional regulator with XRE-family HTH domain